MQFIPLNTNHYKYILVFMIFPTVCLSLSICYIFFIFCFTFDRFLSYLLSLYMSSFLRDNFFFNFHITISYLSLNLYL